MIALVLVAVVCAFVKTYAQDGANAPPVNVALYYESCCPYCQEFITGTFKQAWDTPGFTNITNLTFVSYGNAQEKKDSNGEWDFTCQHGENECRGNLADTCVIYLNNWNQNAYAPFMIPYETKLSGCTENAYTAAQQVAQSLGMDWNAINNCINSDQGNQWEHDMAVMTNNLNPAHTYVPWLVVNGQHTQAIQNECQDDLLECVCRRYTGTSPACKTTKKELGVCYKD
jgi:interferon gamma-inducible protein 30